MIKSGRSEYQGSAIVEWAGGPEMFSRLSGPMTSPRHRGAGPTQIAINLRVRITGSGLGLREGDIGRVISIAPSGVMTAPVDSSDQAEAGRYNLMPSWHVDFFRSGNKQPNTGLRIPNPKAP